MKSNFQAHASLEAMKARNRALAAEIAAAPRIWLALRLLIVYSVLLCLWAAGPFWGCAT